MSKKNLEQNKENLSNKLWVKILVPAIILVVIVGIFIFKNASTEVENDKLGQVNVKQDEEKVQDAQGIDYSSSEFALDATMDFDLPKLLSYGLPVIIDFGADYCVPCKEMEPVLEQLNEEIRGKAIVKFVDINKNPHISQAIPLRVIPTQFFFDKDGKPYVPKDTDAGFLMYENEEIGAHVMTAHEGGMSKDQILAVLKEMGVE